MADSEKRPNEKIGEKERMVRVDGILVPRGVVDTLVQKGQLSTDRVRKGEDRIEVSGWRSGM